MITKSIYAKIEKIYHDKQIVEGIISKATPDDDDDLIPQDVIKAAWPDYMSFANVREMHDPKAIGKILKFKFLEDGTVWVRAKIVDRDAWEKVKEGIYKGFSIGGRALAWIKENLNGKEIRRITKMLLFEISLVDRPAHPDAKLLLWKGATVANHQKAIATLQQKRDQMEVDGDLEGALSLSQAIALAIQATDDGAEEEVVAESADEAEEEHQELGKESPTAEKKEGNDDTDGDGDTEEDTDKDNKTAKPSLKKGKRLPLAAVVSTFIAPLAESDPVAKLLMESFALQKVAGKKEQNDPTAELQKTLTAQADTIRKLEDRILAIEKAPATGGPVLRPVDKPAPTQLNKLAQADGQPSPADIVRSQLDEVRRQALIEPNPSLKAAYNRQAETLQDQLQKLLS